MLAFLRLTRPLNLLIIAITMVLMRYGVIVGIMERGITKFLAELDTPVQRPELMLPENFGPQLPLYLFILLVLSTVLIAAGGNVINDYFDTRIDRVNKPDDVIVGRSVKRRVAMTGHLTLSGLGLLIGVFVAWRAGMPQWALIPAFSIGALWTYSTSFKRQLIIGNGLVATLTALVPLTVGLYELPLLKRAFATPQVLTLSDGTQYEMEPVLPEFWYWILGYAAFAFMSTLVRELQKDMADVKGDEAEGCRTVPIVWGMRWAKGIALFHIGVIVTGLLLVRAWLPDHSLTYWYIGIGIIGPLLLSAGFTYIAHSRKEHVTAGHIMKLAMLMAIGYTLIIPSLP
jgi:4-hydroxybenzoate polyprenyltransferase